MTNPGTEKFFDLNIQEFLSTWGQEDALRELIANAIDEQELSKSSEIEVNADAHGGWHIRDCGRGLRPEHFVQTESPEKREHSDRMIGNFGVGLKDAVATLARLGVDVRIRSRWGSYRTTSAPKARFEDIVTLHMGMAEGVETVTGTDNELRNLDSAAMETAKSWFLHFRPKTVLETMSFGEIIRPDNDGPRVYVNGVFVADEPDFIFSYNITKLLASKRKGLNRDRRSITRDLYRERVVDLIKKAESPEVLEDLWKALKVQQRGGELTWKPVLLKAATSLQAAQPVVFITAAEMEADPGLVSDMRRDGSEPVTVSEDQGQNMLGVKTPAGEPLRTLKVFAQERQSKFQYQFVDASALDDQERGVFDLTVSIASIVTPLRLPPVLISETVRPDDDCVAGLWDPATRRIIIKRSELRNAESFAATLLHELAHWDSAGKDQSFEFEACLTKYLGRLAMGALQ